MAFHNRSGFAIRKIFCVLSGMIFLCWACQDEEICEDITANDLRIGFYRLGQDHDQWAVVDSLRVFSLEQADVPVHEHLNSVSVLELPLNPTADNCAFVIDFYPITDTIWITYQRETQFISVACGFTMFFELTGINHTNNHIVAIEEANTYVTNTLDEHLKVFIPDTGNGDEPEPGFAGK